MAIVMLPDSHRIWMFSPASRVNFKRPARIPWPYFSARVSVLNFVKVFLSNHFCSLAAQASLFHQCVIKANSLVLSELERAMGIEPTYQAWEARVLPLNYARR